MRSLVCTQYSGMWQGIYGISSLQEEMGTLNAFSQASNQTSTAIIKRKALYVGPDDGWDICMCMLACRREGAIPLNDEGEL